LEIKKVNIENYKCFKGKFSVNLNSHVNIFVGNNESGKSTILEAINLALSGTLDGKYLKNELNPYLFNYFTVQDYTESLLKNDIPSQAPPSILIEVYFDSNCQELAAFKGNGNSERTNACGLSLRIEFDPEYQSEYEALVKTQRINTIPIEYYRIIWQSFARDSITAKSIPMKPSLIDSSTERYQNGSDIYISRIMNANLDETEKAAIMQEYRRLKEEFGQAESIKNINDKIKSKSKLTDKEISISVNLTTYNSWQTTLLTYLNNIPFQYIGKGEQCIVKTDLALGHSKSKEANVILIEEPENHLTHTKLNNLLAGIEKKCEDKQIIIATHSSFVANKLGIENIIIINKQKLTPLKTLSPETFDFFKKLPGYQTLRQILCKKAILVEGPSDELIFQKAYMSASGGKLPIYEELDVISVGLSFERFLEISLILEQPTGVITDNDGDYIQKIEKKYKKYEGKKHIKIFADNRDGNNNTERLNTLELQFIDANLNILERIIKILNLNDDEYRNKSQVIDYMINNKTEWALRVFETDKEIYFPAYINNAVRWARE